MILMGLPSLDAMDTQEKKNPKTTTAIMSDKYIDGVLQTKNSLILFVRKCQTKLEWRCSFGLVYKLFRMAHIEFA